jgi:hypothetical protein
MRGYSLDEIVNMFPAISLGDVHLALAFYSDNMQDINDEFAADEKAAKEPLTESPSTIPFELI